MESGHRDLRDVAKAPCEVDYDDFLIALPEKEHLATMSKEVPLFLRYLKVVTDQEGRAEAFRGFLERAKTGLVVESDVYITAEELLAVMWKNGYSDSERNAIQRLRSYMAFGSKSMLVAS